MQDRRMHASVTYLKSFLSLLTFIVSSGVYTEPTRYDLIHHLLNAQRYDHSLPPAFYEANATDVSMELAIFDLNSESDLNMEYEFTTYLRLNWTDKRLDFTANGTSFDFLTLGEDIINKLWIPDLYFIHERKAELHSLFTKNQLARIYRNGTVHYSGRFSLRLHCVMNLRYFPYDTQTCEIVIQSYAFTKDELLLYWNGNHAVNVDVNAINLEFEDPLLWRSFKSPYNHPVGNFSTLNAKITFWRRAESFEIIYIAPPIVLVIISMTSFLLADSISARVTICTGALTQLILQWSGNYKTLPTVSDLTFIDMWMLGNLICIGLILISNVGIYHFVILKVKPNSQGPKPYGNEPKDSRLGIPASRHFLRDQPISQPLQRQKQQQRQQSIGLDLNEPKDKYKSRLLKHEHPLGQSIEKKYAENNDGKSHQHLSNNSDWKDNEMQTLSNDNQRNESDNSIGQALQRQDTEETDFNEHLNNNEGITSTTQLEDVHTSLNNDHRSQHAIKRIMQKDMEESEDEEVFNELLKDNNSITTRTQLKDVQTRLNDDPRFKRAKNRDMVSEWYQKFIDKKKKEEFQCLLKEKVKGIKEWKRAEKKIDHDSRFVVVDATTREKWFKEYRSCSCSRVYYKIRMDVICFSLLAGAYIVFLACFWTKWAHGNVQ